MQVQESSRNGSNSSLSTYVLTGVVVLLVMGNVSTDAINSKAFAIEALVVESYNTGGKGRIVHYR